MKWVAAFIFIVFIGIEEGLGPMILLIAACIVHLVLEKS